VCFAGKHGTPAPANPGLVALGWRMAALVGLSEGGKTTIINLLQLFLGVGERRDAIDSRPRRLGAARVPARGGRTGQPASSIPARRRHPRQHQASMHALCRPATRDRERAGGPLSEHEA
jgi:hypothetical protein